MPFSLKRSAAVLGLPVLMFAAHADATNLFDPSVSGSGVINNSAIQLDGSILSFGPSAGAWTVDVFAGVGECIRLAVTAQAADLELTVIAPNGTVYRNDDGGGSLRPLVKIASAPNNGWYTVHASSFSGAPVEGNFTLLYGRYSAGNANCGTPTSPSLTSQSLQMEMLDEEAATAIKSQGAEEAAVAPPKAKSPGSSSR